MNPFQDHYDSCNHGNPRDKYESLDDGPHLVDIEPVGLCNFSCLMCPTGVGALKRSQGFMSFDTYKNIIKKTEPFKSAIRYICWGESLLHPLFVEMVRTATKSGRITHLNTNASKLTPKMAGDLVEAGLTSIKFSFQGTDRETYKMMRQTDFFDGMLEAIGYMRDARRDGLPYISASTSVTDETPEMVGDFRKRLEPLVDHLSIGRTIFDFLDFNAVPKRHRERLMAAAAACTAEKNHPVPCPEVYDKLSIHWDGAVRVCCNDAVGETDLGNVNVNSMEEIWRHPTMEMYRKRLAVKDYSLPLCESCYDYQDLVDEHVHKIS